MGLQPEGLADSSRWSKRSADHRKTIEMIPDPERVSEVLAPLRGAGKLCLLSGGLRCAATTGYYLPALQAENRLGEGSGARSSGSNALSVPLRNWSFPAGRVHSLRAQLRVVPRVAASDRVESFPEPRPGA